MKILWFANSPCGASSKLNPSLYFGGWLTSLETELVQKENISLSVCFYNGEIIEPFFYNKTKYYPIYRTRSGSKFGRFINRLINKSSKNDQDLQKLLHVIAEVNPDIIHIHGTEENFGLIQSHVNIPCVISIQGLLSPYSEKYFSGIPAHIAFRYEGILRKIKFNSFLFQYKHMLKVAIRERKILMQTKNIIGRTDWDKRITRILSHNSKYYIGNEMLRPIFYKNKWEKNKFGEVIKIVSVSSEKLYKGLDTIVKTAKLLHEYKKIKFEWVVIGQSKSNSIPNLLKKWLNFDLKSVNVNLVGLKDEQEITKIMTNADIYCQVSHIENSPNSLCEAMIIGMPIIATFVGGTDSLLTNQKEGILVQEGDPYSLAGAIKEITENFELAKYYAENARIRALNRHDKETIVTELITTYNDIIR
jgi:glycosyltransferase involved in cell wall biosynthesis